MSRSTFFVVALLVALLSEAPARQQDTAASGPQASYRPLTRVAEQDRQTVFSELMDCREEVSRKADQLYPSAEGGPNSRVHHRQRSRAISTGNAVCGQDTMKKHQLQRDELGQIESEGTCKRWAPLTGTPTC
jgi:hypothetical protein